MRIMVVEERVRGVVMEQKNRRLWIILGIVAVIAAMLVACLSGCLAVAAGLGLFVNRSVEVADGSPRYQDRMERSFEVGPAPEVTIDNFAGRVTVRAGQPGRVDAVVTKRASRSSDLTGTGVGLHETQGGGLQIKAGRPLFAQNVSVDLDLTVPPGTQLKVELGAGEVAVSGLQAPLHIDLGAGNIQIEGVRGPIEARTDAGNIEARGVEGVARLDVATGSVYYGGVPRGDCSFRSRLGAVALELPPDINAEVDLQTSLGIIEVQCSVEGVVKPRRVQGTIGDGSQAVLHAESSMGAIALICR